MLRHNRICEERPSGKTVSLFSAKRTAGGFAGSSGNVFAKAAAGRCARSLTEIFAEEGGRLSVAACISSRGGVKCNVVRKKEV